MWTAPDLWIKVAKAMEKYGLFKTIEELACFRENGRRLSVFIRIASTRLERQPVPTMPGESYQGIFSI
jgi:hypothetical protein